MSTSTDEMPALRDALFRVPRRHELLNDLGVGLALASATATAFSQLLSHAGFVTLVTGLPTFLFGVLWSALLRSNRKLAFKRVRIGWILSVPIACANASVSAGLLALLDPTWAGGDPLKSVLGGMLLGATAGVIFWFPALVLTLVCFGIPRVWAHHVAERGLAGRERGELIVGAVSALIALLSMVAAATLRPLGDPAHELGFLPVLLGLAGLVVSLAATAAAVARVRARRAFVEQVEAGRVPHFRVDALPEGKVLLRVLPQGEHYRVADFEEAVATIDAAGELAPLRSREG